MTKDDFTARVASILDGRELAALSDDEVQGLMSVTQYATDVLMNEAEGRGLIETFHGSPCIPYSLPKGVQMIETILTR